MCDCMKDLFPKVNKYNFLRHYVPLTGALCHQLFAVNYLSPKLFEQ